MSALASGAQDLPLMLSRVGEKAAGKCVTLTYSFSSSGDVRIEDEGLVEVQDSLWHLKGTVLEIFTDASSTWVIDNEAEEVIVEPAWSYDDLENFYKSTVASGASLEIRILSETVSDRKPTTCFTPTFGPEWIVTDLR